MKQSKKHNILIQKYLRSISFMLGTIGIIILLCTNFGEWRSFIENLGLTFTVSGITLLIYEREILFKYIDRNIQETGIKELKHGRDSLFDDIGNFNSFLGKSKEIDFIGISMYSFINTKNLYPTLIELAQKGTKIRIIMAHPCSEELKKQERAEKKPGMLQVHIRNSIETLVAHLKSQDINNLEVYFSDTLPKVFIFRKNNTIYTSAYFLRGPFDTPSFKITNEDNGFYNSYITYIEDLIESAQKYDFKSGYDSQINNQKLSDFSFSESQQHLFQHQTSWGKQ